MLPKALYRNTECLKQHQRTLSGCQKGLIMLPIGPVMLLKDLFMMQKCQFRRAPHFVRKWHGPWTHMPSQLPFMYVLEHAGG